MASPTTRCSRQTENTVIGTSRQHCFWQRAIAFREAIAELEMQVSLLTTLMERQQAHREWVDGDFSEPKTK
jgi:hypothetical protein